MRPILAIAAASVAVILTGCMSFEYDGEKLPPNAPAESIKVFRDSSAIPRPYRVIGSATVSGDYKDVSRERMIGKLSGKAADFGADAIIITRQGVVPVEMFTQGRSPFVTQGQASGGGDGSSWESIYHDLNLGYDNVRTPANTQITQSEYKRIITAEFIRFGSDQESTPQNKE